MQLVENNKNNSVNTKQITDITEVLEKTKRSWVDETDVSGYKWKLVSDNQNEPTQVHFYKEDMNDTLSVSLSSIFDYQLKEYLHNLIVEEDNEKQRLEEESRQYKQDIMDDKLDEFMESYELFIKQQVKNEISKQDIIPNLTNIRKMVDEFSKNHSGIHYGFGDRRMNSISIQKEWYLENYEKLSQIVLSIDPEHKPSSEKYE